MDIVCQSDAPFSAECLYNLVADIDAYKDFLPWCSDSHIDRSEGDKVWATLHISYHMFSMSMTTENSMKPCESIALDLHRRSQYLKSLHGEWTFREMKEGVCSISLNMHIQFASRILEFTLRPLFDYIGNTLVQSFIDRAHQQSGNSPGQTESE